MNHQHPSSDTEEDFLDKQRTPGGRGGTLGTVDKGRVGYVVSYPT